MYLTAFLLSVAFSSATVMFKESLFVSGTWIGQPLLFLVLLAGLYLPAHTCRPVELSLSSSSTLMHVFPFWLVVCIREVKALMILAVETAPHLESSLFNMWLEGLKFLIHLRACLPASWEWQTFQWESFQHQECVVWSLLQKLRLRYHLPHPDLHFLHRRQKSEGTTKKSLRCQFNCTFKHEERQELYPYWW